jgi:hypothetical protein
MAKRATVEPAWLDAMLVTWGRIKVREALGYPAESVMFKERIPSPARSYEPEGFCALDFRALEAAMDTLQKKHKYAILHCYKPWTADQVREAYADEFDIHWGTEAGQRKIQRLLHEAAALIRSHMDEAQGVSVASLRTGTV